MSLQTFPALVGDLVLLLLVVALIPVVLIVVGTPVALLVRLVIEIAQRM